MSKTDDNVNLDGDETRKETSDKTNGKTKGTDEDGDDDMSTECKVCGHSFDKVTYASCPKCDQKKKKKEDRSPSRSKSRSRRRSKSPTKSKKKSNSRSRQRSKSPTKSKKKSKSPSRRKSKSPKSKSKRAHSKSPSRSSRRKKDKGDRSSRSHSRSRPEKTKHSRRRSKDEEEEGDDEEKRLNPEAMIIENEEQYANMKIYLKKVQEDIATLAAVLPVKGTKDLCRVDPDALFSHDELTVPQLIATLHEYAWVPHQPNMGGADYCKVINPVMVRKDKFYQGEDPNNFGIKVYFPPAPASASTCAGKYGAWFVPNPKYLELSAKAREENDNQKPPPISRYIDGPDQFDKDGKKTVDSHMRGVNKPDKARFKMGQTDKWTDKEVVYIASGGKAVAYAELNIALMRLRHIEAKGLIAMIEHDFLQAAISYSMLWAVEGNKIFEKVAAMSEDEMEAEIQLNGVPCRFSDKAYDLGLPGVLDIRPRLANKGGTASKKGGPQLFGPRPSHWSKRDFIRKKNAESGRETQTRIATKRICPTDAQFNAAFVSGSNVNCADKTLKNWKEWHVLALEASKKIPTRGLPVFRSRIVSQLDDDTGEVSQTVVFPKKYAKDENQYATRRLHKCFRHKDPDNLHPTCIACDNTRNIKGDDAFAAMFEMGYCPQFCPHFDVWFIYLNQDKEGKWLNKATNVEETYPIRQTPIPMDSRYLNPGDIYGLVAIIKGTNRDGGSIGKFINLKLEPFSIYVFSRARSKAASVKTTNFEVVSSVASLLPKMPEDVAGMGTTSMGDEKVRRLIYNDVPNTLATTLKINDDSEPKKKTKKRPLGLKAPEESADTKTTAKVTEPEDGPDI